MLTHVGLCEQVIVLLKPIYEKGQQKQKLVLFFLPAVKQHSSVRVNIGYDTTQH